ncbi:hypothetical protein GC175_22225 [bacterium]|nr:hypothetical protein [bacterium]
MQPHAKPRSWKRTIVSVVTVMASGWTLPLASLWMNYREPGFTTALGIAYGFGIGWWVHILALLIWMVRRQRRDEITLRPLFLLIFSLAILSALTLPAGRGQIGAW